MPGVATETSPVALVFKSPLGAPEIVRLVVEARPALSILKSVLVANVGVDELMTKSVVPVKVEEAANIESLA